MSIKMDFMAYENDRGLVQTPMLLVVLVTGRDDGSLSE